ncbi:DUF1566 domain-containing protein [Crenothrix polyspora]|uniref:Lcl C-terminal domain-containing protein n=1 Tax=Crenothrix polyspora TaxID=360316 RepID=A0A1R4H7S1_9GAMM|nr:DUF1566 domain-containing protein [Crenothrix polyspora]SJM92249.1 conserved hypothetical protein [Crenothrix polyspora]
MIFNPSPHQGFKPVLIVAGLLLALPFSHMALSAAVVKLAPKPVYKIPLNDTGIATCSNESKSGLPCPVVGFPGQDAQYGRDKTHNNNADGHAGFSFTKISNTGKALAASAKNWNCVKDNVTRLMWEVKANDKSLHDMNWTYSWYNPDNKTNGGAEGYQNAGKCVNTISCDTDAYVKAVNKAGWCGYKDWRMPTRMELIVLASLNGMDPALDKKYFPESNILMFWSSSPSVDTVIRAWLFVFNNGGYSDNDFKGYGHQVRLVRSGQ